VGDLARRFKVSAVTLRSDLGQLAEQGILVRSYGGGMMPREPDQDFPLNVKRTINHAEKVRIGKAATKLLKSHQTVILDSGTTSAEVARAIKQAKIAALTVVTHAVNIAQEFLDAPNTSVIMIGGLMRHVSGSFVGPQAERMIRELHAHQFFLGIDGLSTELELSTPDLLEAQLNAIMMQVAQEVTVIADASKLGKRSLSAIGDISKVHRLITDSRADPDMLDRIRKKGVEVIVA
jgi:DeoR family transcriptional regulator, aga operon transcriptional repressor